MTVAENLYSNLLTVGILLGLMLIIYAHLSGKTLVDMIKDMREAFRDKTDDVVEYMPTGFEGIR